MALAAAATTAAAALAAAEEQERGGGGEGDRAALAVACSTAGARGLRGRGGGQRALQAGQRRGREASARSGETKGRRAEEEIGGVEEIGRWGGQKSALPVSVPRADRRRRGAPDK